MRYVVYDAETRSTASLRQVGSHIYTCDPASDVWCVSWCIVTDDTRGPITTSRRGPITTWLPSDPVPPDILAAAADPGTLIVSFNDSFERQVEQRILHPKYHWPIFPIERRRCAQAVALAHALPASLDGVAAALQLKGQKTAAGKRAMKLLAQPRKPRKGEDPSKIYWHDDTKLLQTLAEYNHIDVEITAEIIARLGFIPPQEQRVWELDAMVNARGIGIDAELLDAAINIGEQASEELQEKLAALTDGEITGSAQTERILKWLAGRGCELPNIQDDTLLEALKRPDLTPAVRQMIALRRDGAHAAVNKLATLRRWLAPDHRIRQVYRYHGASSGRFTSIGAQMQNLKKPAVDDVSAAIEAVRFGNLPCLRTRYQRPLAIVGDITRGLIVPAPGHRLFIGDLSGIESRGLAWLCNEQTKLEAWREFDRTGDPTKEPYYRFATEELRLSGAGARSTGKTADLAYGYQGGVGAWRRLAPAGDNTPDQTVSLYRQAWLRAHPNIKKFWSVSLRQAMNAIENNDAERFTVARITFQREGRFLFMELPSGRKISYPFARIYSDEDSKSFTFRDASGGRWEWYHVLKRRGAFGGLIAENATQALCRDIFVEAMLRLEAANYRLIAHLHDEFICEVPNDFGDLEEFRAIISTPPAWAPDFPIATKARIADRFIEVKATAKPADIEDPDEDISGVEAPWEGEPQFAHAAAASEASNPSMPPPSPDDMPRPETDDVPPRGNGPDPGYGGNGFDKDEYTAGEQPRGAPTERYVYKDAQGLLFMRVIRTSSKSFPTQHWQDGRWVNGWPPGPLIPYRLPELIAAPAPEPVWICEGEKDADNVAALDLVATTNPGGAKVFQPELAQWFKGKQLAYVVEDNDSAGAEHTRKILAALRGIIPCIAVIHFPELSDKGDVSDWLEQGGNKKLLLARAEQARQRAETQRAYVITNLSTVQPRALQWIWPGHLARGGLELMAGTPEIGKSQIHCQYIACATTGREWPNGAPGIVRCRVVVLTAEDTTADTLVPRLKAAGAELKLIEELKAIRRNDRDEMFLLGEDLAVLEQMIADFGDVGLVTLDPITAYMGHAKHFDSHKATDVRSQLSPLKKLAERTGVAISAVTHPPKNASARALDHFIGSQAYVAAARIAHLCVPEMEGGENGAKRATGRRFFTCPKINIDARQPTLIYTIDVVEIGFDETAGTVIRAPVIRWQGESELTADEALAAARATKTKGSDAKEFLADILISGPVLQKVIIERGAERGFSHDQLRRAKRALGVKAFKRRGENLTSPWLWALPQHVPSDAEEGED